MRTSGRNVFLLLLFSTRAKALSTFQTNECSLSIYGTTPPRLLLVVWYECCKEDISRLESIQNNGMRLILDERWDCPSSEMRSKLGWTTLANQQKLLRDRYTRRCLHGMVPKYKQSMLCTTEKMGLRSAKHLNDIYLLSLRTNWLTKLFIYLAGRDWNDLLLSVREASDHVFKTNIRSYFKD